MTLSGSQKNGLVFTCLFAGVQVFYAKTWQAGFVTDFTGLQERLEGAPLLGFLNSFGFPAMHQVGNFFLWIFYECFGTRGLPWHLIFTSLHALNGLLGYLLVRKILARRGFAASDWATLTGVALFVFSPYAVETVVWRVSFGFLFCSSMVLASLWQLAIWLENGRRKHLILTHGFFLAALFSFELALALPVMAGILAFCFGDDPRYRIPSRYPIPSRSRYRIPSRYPIPAPAPGYFSKIALPHLLILAGYFSLNKLVLGGWVGHYGEGVHLNFNLPTIAGNLLKYLLKYLLFWREWSHGTREKLMLFCDKPAVGWATLVLLLIVTGLIFKAFQRRQGSKPCRRLAMAGIFFPLFFAALLPVGNLYVAWILQGENDRYGYLASLFFFAGISVLAFSLPKFWRIALLGGWFCLSLFFLHRTTGYWQNGARVFYGLLEDFRWQEAPEIYVLAFPENYHGIPLFKDFTGQDRALPDALKYAVGKPAHGKIYQIAQFNMTSPGDGVSVQSDSARHFTVNFNQWGNWWWRNGIGAGDYETEAYQFKVAENGSRVFLKKPVAGAVVIFSVGEKWESIPMENQE